MEAWHPQRRLVWRVLRVQWVCRLFFMGELRRKLRRFMGELWRELRLLGMRGQLGLGRRSAASLACSSPLARGVFLLRLVWLRRILGMLRVCRDERQLQLLWFGRFVRPVDHGRIPGGDGDGIRPQ